MSKIPEGYAGTAGQLEKGRQQFQSDVQTIMDLAVRDRAVDRSLPEEEQVELEKAKRAADDFFNANLKAKFKVEVQFGLGRSAQAPFPGSIHIYRSGSTLSGGGDEIVYPCPDDKCPGLIEPENLLPVLALCPECFTKWNRDTDLADGRFYRLTAQNWAFVIERTFRRVGMDADLYLKSHPEDIRSAALLEQARERRGEVYARVRAKRVPVMYPLDRIMKDVNAGADLSKRIYAFITA